MAGPGTVPPKRKEIYKYEAPWTVFSMNWSVRPDKRFRLALGSFVEEYNNKVQVNSLLKDKEDYSDTCYMVKRLAVSKNAFQINSFWHCVLYQTKSFCDLA